MVQTNFTITNASDLANAIKSIDLTGAHGATSTDYTFGFDPSGASTRT